MTWMELGTLVVCLFLDFIEYAIPMLMAPIVGDLLDLAGLIFCIVFFGWVGLVSLVEIVPGLDVFPLYTFTWMVWYIRKRWGDTMNLGDMLERWK